MVSSMPLVMGAGLLALASAVICSALRLMASCLTCACSSSAASRALQAGQDSGDVELVM